VNVVRWIKLGRAVERKNRADVERRHIEDSALPTFTVRAFLSSVYCDARVPRP